MTERIARARAAGPSVPFPARRALGPARTTSRAFNDGGEEVYKEVYRGEGRDLKGDVGREVRERDGLREREERREREREERRLAEKEERRAAEKEERREREREERKAVEREERKALERREAERAEKERDGREKEKEKEKEKEGKKGKREHVRPPQVIVDKATGATYRRVGFLGEGGFARVYEVMDDAGSHKAIKVVNKSSIRTKRNKTKLWAEIKLHQMLQHTHVVRFDDCFEDDENVYMVLELCDNGSLNDLLRRRKRYTEAEAKFFLVQLISACQYMHDMSVIHRDLKLGNLFLDRNMNIKVGDFGLAALIENPGDRKKTICGTPNYIAPEVLFDTANGHSFEVDVWSVGVIMYTLVVGQPPFQTKDVKTIYRRIKENRYEFPADREISRSARDLIMSILNTDPEKRPTLDQIMTHPWFLDGAFPSIIPNTANDGPPDFSHLTPMQSRRNFEAVRRRAMGVEQVATPPTDKAALGPSIIAQERDFKSAVQPNSPISALLASARQPLVQAPGALHEPSLLRKLTASGAHATLSPRRGGSQRPVPSAVAGPGPSSRPPPMENLDEEDEGVEVEEEKSPQRRGYASGVRDREVAVQKARIASQMAAMRLSDSEAPTSSRGTPEDTRPSSRMLTPSSATSLFDRMEANLTSALSLSKAGGFSVPNESRLAAPRVFVVSWLDYCAKYGMGFAMSDGTVSVHFNDSSSVALAPGKGYFDYVDVKGEKRHNHPIDQHPSDLANKVYLLHKFESYMLSRLCGDYDYTYTDDKLTTGMVYIQKYLRTKHVILFKLSNGVLQFNFYDHTKLILSDDGLVVSIIDKHYNLHTYSLSLLFADHAEKDKHKFDRYVSKVQYARDLLARLRAHGGVSGEKEEKKMPKPIR